MAVTRNMSLENLCVLTDAKLATEIEQKIYECLFTIVTNTTALLCNKVPYLGFAW